MARVKPQVGQIVEIIPGVRAKLIYASARFRDVVALLRLGAPNSRPADIVYTSGQGVGKLWPVVGFEECTTDERRLTRRIVGGNVYVGDDIERAVSTGDYGSLPQMDVLGAGLIERWAADTAAG